MASPQTLDEEDRRVLAVWAVACAERVRPLIDADVDATRVIDDALARTRAFGAGRSTAAAEIALRMQAVKAAGAATTPAGTAAARSVAQASAVAHLGAHALGAAAYAVKAVTLADPDRQDEGDEEIDWQIAQLTGPQRTALRKLPPLGLDTAGPLGPGLLTRGLLGSTIRTIQERVGSTSP